MPRSTLQRGVIVRIRKVRHPPSRAWEIWKPEPSSIKGGVWRPLVRADRCTQCGLPCPEDSSPVCANSKIKSFAQSPSESAPSGNVGLMWFSLGRPKLDWLSRGGCVYPSGRYMQRPVMEGQTPGWMGREGGLRPCGPRCYPQVP